MRGVLGAVLLVWLLGGCAQLRALPGMGPDGDETLRFLLRLAEADAAELAELGRGLEAPGGSTRQALRQALWQSTPGHPGFALEPARGALRSLVADEAALPAETRALVRVYLAQLDRRSALLQANADLSAANRELREQIEALTDLERRMGEDGENER